MTARDFDFDTITLDSGSVVVTVIDDIPINQSQTSSTGTVEEEHLNNFVTATGFGSTGNEDETATPDLDLDAGGNFAITTQIASGTLAGSVLVGADEPAIYGLRVITAPEPTGLTSKGATCWLCLTARR